jgi:hypothetical protein
MDRMFRGRILKFEDFAPSPTRIRGGPPATPPENDLWFQGGNAPGQNKGNWPIVGLLLRLLLAADAARTSLGLALSTWMARR